MPLKGCRSPFGGFHEVLAEHDARTTPTPTMWAPSAPTCAMDGLHRVMAFLQMGSAQS